MNALKKGMADTGAEMTKLSDEIKQIRETTSSQSRALRRVIVELFNVSVSMKYLNASNKIILVFFQNPQMGF